jgi:hypothetical protein
LIRKKVNDNASGTIIIKNSPPFAAGKGDEVSMSSQVEDFALHT